MRQNENEFTIDVIMMIMMIMTMKIIFGVGCCVSTEIGIQKYIETEEKENKDNETQETGDNDEMLAH